MDAIVHRRADRPSRRSQRQDCAGEAVFPRCEPERSASRAIVATNPRSLDVSVHVGSSGDRTAAPVRSVVNRARRLAAGASQPERRHLLAVAHEKHVADERGVIPGLALDRLEPRELGELIGGCLDERQLSLLR
jgi:hypothetical protein